MNSELELNHAAIVLREGDDVAVAKQKIPGGTTLVFEGGSVTLPGDVPAGHKFALHQIADGSGRKAQHVAGILARAMRGTL